MGASSACSLESLAKPWPATPEESSASTARKRSTRRSRVLAGIMGSYLDAVLAHAQHIVHFVAHHRQISRQAQIERRIDDLGIEGGLVIDRVLRRFGIVAERL